MAKLTGKSMRKREIVRVTAKFASTAEAIVAIAPPAHRIKHVCMWTGNISDQILWASVTSDLLKYKKFTSHENNEGEFGNSRSFT